MRSIVKTGGIISILATLSACASTTPDFNRIDPKARTYIKKMDSVLISRQTQVGADIKVSKLSSYIQGPALPVVIDIGLNTYRSYKANEIMEPIHGTLSDYDYTEVIKTQFNQALENSKLEGANGLKILQNEPVGFRTAYIQQSTADAVMFIDVHYAFTPNFDALNLKSDVMVFPVNTSLYPFKEKPDYDDIIEYEDNIYRNQFMASIPVGIKEGSKEENGIAWADMSEEKLEGRMQKAAQKLADFIANDLSLDEVPDELAISSTPSVPGTEIIKSDSGV